LNVFEAISADDLNQLLGTHAPYVIYDNVAALIGASLVGNTSPVAPTFVVPQPLVSSSGKPISIDQPITMVGTVLDRVELPISILSGVGQSVLVGLYADAAGVPTGLPLAQTYVPRELIPLAGTTLPGHGLMMSDNWTLQYTMSPPAPYDTYTSEGFASDGVVAIFVGGLNGAVATTGVIIGLISLANGTITQWQAGPAYPVALAEAGVAVDNASYVYVAGGFSGAGVPNASVYTALYSSNPPTIGAWQSQNALPQTLVNNAMTVISSGTAAGATPILYSVGGLHAGTPGTKVVYAAPISSPGLIGAWTTPAASQFPANILNTTLVQINGYLVAIGGESDQGTPTYVTSVWAAPIHNDNTIGSWVPWPSLPFAYAGTASVLGNTIVYTTQSTVWSLDVSALGQPDPIWQNCGAQWTGAVGSPQIIPITCMAGNYLMNFTVSTYPVTPGSAPLQYSTEMSVPLHVTGLTNTAKYHIIVSPVGNCDQYNVTQVAMSATAPTAAYATGLGQTGPSGGFVAGASIIPAYMITAPQSGWDTPVSNRLTNNATVTYAGGVITMTAVAAADMWITTSALNNAVALPLTADATAVPDTSGTFSIPVMGGVSYTFTATLKAAVSPRNIWLQVNWCDINGNNIPTTLVGVGTDSTLGVIVTGTGIAPINAAYASLVIIVLGPGVAAGEVHTAYNISFNQNFGYVPLSLFVSGKNLRPIHVLDDIVATQPFGWNWITYDYSGKPIQIAECIMPRVNLIAPNDSNMGGPVAGTAAGWTAGANTALAAVANASQPLGAPLPNTPSVPAFPIINSQQCAYELRLTNSSGGAATVSATTATGTSGYAVTAGQNYTAFAYFLAATTGRTVTMQIIWYNAAGGTISTSSGTGTPDVTTGWTQVYVNAVAPALAVTAAVSISIAATATTEAHGATCVSFHLDNSLNNGMALPMLAYFEPGAGPGGMRNLITLGYDSATSQLVSVTPNNPLTYFGTGATATYTATGMIDTQAVWPMNGLVGQVITAPSDLTAVSNSATTTATVLFNTGKTIILTSAGWSNGQPADGSQYSIT
jgi:hypothetical protein